MGGSGDEEIVSDREGLDEDSITEGEDSSSESDTD